MVFLDFDKAKLLEQRTENGGWWDAFREVPVSLWIGGEDLLTWYGEEEYNRRVEPGRPLPVPGTAYWGLISLQKAKQTGRYIFELGRYGGEEGTLLLQMSGENILVYYDWTEKTAQVPYEKLVQAWSDFGDRVREFLICEFPAVKEQPRWGPWLAGEEPYWDDTGPVKLFPSWEKEFESNKGCFDHVDIVET